MMDGVLVEITNRLGGSWHWLDMPAGEGQWIAPGQSIRIRTKNHGLAAALTQGTCSLTARNLEDDDGA